MLKISFPMYLYFNMILSNNKFVKHSVSCEKRRPKTYKRCRSKFVINYFLLLCDSVNKESNDRRNPVRSFCAIFSKSLYLKQYLRK